MPKLLLFDIDGTLISSGGTGTRCMTKAFQQLFGPADGFQSIKMAGNTDPLIIEEALRNNRIALNPEDVDLFQKLYFSLLAEEIKKPNPNKMIMPGVKSLLQLLQKQNTLICGLLTGNWKQGASIKLQYFQLESYFTFGVFADDSKIRGNLVPIALKRCHSLIGSFVRKEDVYIIGDTPLDITSAAPHGVKTIAVATGSYTKAELQTHNPHYCFQNLANNQAVLESIIANEP